MAIRTQVREFLTLAIGDLARTHRPRRGLRRHRALVESLEPRTLLTTFSVTNLNDAGAGSLREAILLANANSGADEITFATSGTIALTTGQMVMTDSLTITGNGADNTIVDAQQLSRIFEVTDTAGNVTLNDLTLKNGRTTDNGSTFSGGAIRAMSSGTLMINRSRISGNSTIGSSANGGAIFTNSGTVLIGACTISGNVVDGYNANGGAIYTASGMVMVSQSILSQNAAAGTFGNGGAICSQSGTVKLYQNTFSENSTAGAESRGGAVATISGALTASQSTFSHNATTGYSGDGGAIFSFSGSVTISQSTLSGNSVTGTEAQGGAVHVYSGPLSISQSTVNNNHATKSAAGGIFSASAPITIKNSIIAGNSDIGAAPDLRPSPTDTLTISNSLIGRSDGTGLTATVGTTPDANGNFIGGTTDWTKINPKLGPLANNGGPTKTHALLTGSVAIDHGSNVLAVDVTNGNAPLTTDQRGTPFTRILDGDHIAAATVDIGAFEFSGLRVVSPSPNSFTLRPTFQWTPIAGAVSYSIHINNESTGVAQFHLGTSIGAAYTPNVDLAIGKFKMWVRPVFASGPGNWSAPHLFNNLTPATWQPMSRVQLTSRPSFSWNALPGAAKYDLWIDNFSTGQKQLIRQDVTGTSFTPATDLSMGLYRIWIRGVDAIGNYAGWSVLQEALIVPAPTPIAPLSATFDRTPTFTWNPVAGAVSYELFVKSQITGAMVINGASTTATNFTPTVNLTDGTYRWWTVAVSAASIGPIRSGGTNPTDIYVGGRPTIIAPLAGSSTSDRTPTFSWHAVDGAVGYQLQVNRISVPQAVVISRAGLTTSFTPVAELTPGTYRAWVRAVSHTNELSPWSIEVNFTVTAVAPTPDSLDADLMLTGLLMSELTPGSDRDVNTHPSQSIVHTQPDQITDVAIIERAVPEGFPIPSTRSAIDDQKPDLVDLDRMMMEFAMYPFLPGERLAVSPPRNHAPVRFRRV